MTETNETQKRGFSTDAILPLLVFGAIFVAGILFFGKLAIDSWF